jgi:hypothetical protein
MGSGFGSSAAILPIALLCTICSHWFNLIAMRLTQHNKKTVKKKQNIRTHWDLRSMSIRDEEVHYSRQHLTESPWQTLVHWGRDWLEGATLVEKAMTLLQRRVGGNKFHYADVSNFLFDFGLHFVNIEIMQHMYFGFSIWWCCHSFLSQPVTIQQLKSPLYYT